ncbi:hypothetical protein [Pedobacter miscanthi]|uniref:Uncharacterized protein n=1 Tax=Pedobacter miscanthi TaxID=2259170 RepID=A0A366LC13_9SPHI|nr:hypothetical protein [Pedobacter miscanthi]RBQ11427.1 hypothetical protein DRW42_02900 [Pedobacter miscanthi]
MKNFRLTLLTACLICSLNFAAKAIIVQDTLHVVRDDQFLNYPLGTFNSFESFKNTNTKLIPSKSISVRPYKNGRTEPATMFALQKSYARFYLNKETKKLELIGSIILGNEMPLQNGIVVGMERTTFFKKMNIVDENTSANTVEITSKTAGIRHFYQFKDNKLASIMIFSNLFYQKD